MSEANSLREYQASALSQAWTNALVLARQDFHVFPLGAWNSPNGGHKAPLDGSSGFKDATTDMAQIEQWAAQYPESNYGIACGPSNLTVIDIDTDRDPEKRKTGPLEWWQLCQKNLGYQENLDEHLTVTTPRGGQHIYLRGAIEKPFGNLKRHGAPNIDIRSANGYVVGPGCRDPQGSEYKFYPLTRSGMRPQPLPGWMRTLVDKDATGEASAASEQQSGEQKTIEIEELRKVLACLDPSAYNDWQETIAAVRITRVTEDGQDCADDDVIDVLDAWSATDTSLAADGTPSYKGRDFVANKYLNDCASEWQPGHKTIGSLIHEAKAIGYTPTPPVVADADRFADAPPPPAPQPSADTKHLPQQPGGWEALANTDREWHKLEGKLEWIVDGLIEAGGLHIVSGGYGTMKTYLLLTMILDMCQGLPTFGEHHAVSKPRQCMYVAGEGAFGFESRVKAYKEARGLDYVDRFTFVREMPLIDRPEVWDQFVQFVASKNLDAIVFDTKTRLMAGLDQNSTKDAGVAIMRLGQLQRLGVAVILVDHTGKDFRKGTKGAVDLPAAAELELIVTGKPKGGVLSVKMEKCKNAREWDADMQFDVVEAPEADNTTLIFRGKATPGVGSQANPGAFVKATTEHRMQSAFVEVMQSSGDAEIFRSAVARKMAEKLVDQEGIPIVPPGDEDDPAQLNRLRSVTRENKRTSATKWLKKQAETPGSVVHQYLSDGSARDPDTKQVSFSFRCPPGLRKSDPGDEPTIH